MQTGASYLPALWPAHQLILHPQMSLQTRLMLHCWEVFQAAKSEQQEMERRSLEYTPGGFAKPGPSSSAGSGRNPSKLGSRGPALRAPGGPSSHCPGLRKQALRIWPGNAVTAVPMCKFPQKKTPVCSSPWGTVDGRNHDKPLMVGIYRGVNIPWFLRWCRISPIQSSSLFCVCFLLGTLTLVGLTPAALHARVPH